MSPDIKIVHGTVQQFLPPEPPEAIGKLLAELVTYYEVLGGWDCSHPAFSPVWWPRVSSSNCRHYADDPNIPARIKEAWLVVADWAEEQGR